MSCTLLYSQSYPDDIYAAAAETFGGGVTNNSTSEASVSSVSAPRRSVVIHSFEAAFNFLLTTGIIEHVLYQSHHPIELLRTDASATLSAVPDAGIMHASISESQMMISTAESLLQTPVKPTRLGRAIVSIGADPDEALLLYAHLYRALDGLHLESPLHLLYLCAPLDHDLDVDFKFLLKIFDNSNRTKQKTFATVFTAVGITESALLRWQFNPPGKAEIGVCSHAVKLHSIMFESKAMATGQGGYSSNPGVSATEYTGAVLGPLRGALSSRAAILTKADWDVICYCKRLTGALALLDLLECRPVADVTRKFSCTQDNLDQLVEATQMTATRTAKLCKALGWSPLEKIISNFKSESLDVMLGADASLGKNIVDLLRIPLMTRKVRLC